MAKFRLQWRGAETKAMVAKAVIGGLNEFHLEVEREAKAILQPGAGVVTGTLRRSVHAGAPSYGWESDDVPPSPTSTERGGTGGLPEKQGNMVVGTIGSGLVYALAVHDGHCYSAFPGYYYIERGYEKVQHKLPEKLQKHARIEGLR